MTRALRKRANTFSRRWRETRMFIRAMHSPHHPVLAQIIPTRRCNLACTYCNEYDKTSAPIETAEIIRRIDRLAGLGAGIVTFSGGEPTLHPDLDKLIAHVRSRGAIATLITNGLLLTRERVEALNRAGLDYLQISIDNVTPDGVSHKSLRTLDRKLQLLADHAEFAVTINSVLGPELANPEDAYTIAARARQLGFTSTVGLLHDGDGQSAALSEAATAIYRRIRKLDQSLFSFAHQDFFQRNLIRARPNDWHCPAGRRYLYICEDGLVHYCSQQRGAPAIPLANYGPADLEREGAAVKGCAPMCTVSCVHQVSMLDRFRTAPDVALNDILRASKEQDPSFREPTLVRALAWMFLHPGRRRWFGKAVVRLGGAR
ncbi:MAG: radical SAM protein [Bryobacteraceae bacterium]